MTDKRYTRRGTYGGVKVLFFVNPDDWKEFKRQCHEVYHVSMSEMLGGWIKRFLEEAKTKSQR